MFNTQRSRTFWPALLLMGCASLLAHAPARAQSQTAPAGLVPIAPQGDLGSNHAGKDGQNIFDTTAPNGGAPADLVSRVGIDQNLDAKIPLDLQFKDEDGKTVELADYFGKKPVLITMLQLTCDQVCSAQFGAMNTAFKDPKFGFTPGKEFEILTVSIDPKETPMIAKDVQDERIKDLGKPEAREGWHFLTGTKENTRALAKALGIKYIWEEKNGQFIHPDGIVMATPDGHVSRYFMRLDYDPRAMRYSIVEASKDRVGTIIDQIALSCFHYNPTTGKYTLQFMLVLRLLGGAFVLGSVGAIAFALMREKRGPKPGAAATTGAAGNNKKVKTA